MVFSAPKKNPSFPTPGPMKIAVGFFGAENHQLPRGGASAGKFDFPEKALRPDFATQEFDHRGLREVFRRVGPLHVFVLFFGWKWGGRTS